MQETKRTKEAKFAPVVLGVLQGNSENYLFVVCISYNSQWEDEQMKGPSLCNGTGIPFRFKYWKNWSGEGNICTDLSITVNVCFGCLTLLPLILSLLYEDHFTFTTRKLDTVLA